MKTFMLNKRFGEKTRFTIGRFPDLSVDAARKVAMEFKAKIARGIDPKEEKRKNTGRDEVTFGDLCNNYMTKFSEPKKARPKDDWNTIRQYLTNLQNKKAHQIKKDDILNIHRDIGNNVGEVRANRVYTLILAIFNKNIEWGWQHPNPCIGIKKFKEVSRDRFIQPEELEPLFKSVEKEESQINKDCIYLLLLTGARKSNVFAMKWEEISFARKIWRIPDTKNGEPVNIPLTAEAIEILERRKQNSQSPFVLPGTGKSGHIADIKKAWHRILKRANIQDLRIHDLRRSVGSYMAITGSTTAMIGKQLGHKSKTATAIYERLNIDPVRCGLEKATKEIFKFARK